MDDSNIHLHNCWLVVDTSKTSGGVQYKRLRRQRRVVGDALVTREDRSKIVSHADITKTMERILSRVLWMCRKHCVRVSFGWIASDESLQLLMDKVVALRNLAAKANAQAEKAGSVQRIDVGFIAAPLKMEAPGVRREVLMSVRHGLQAVLEALRTDDQTQYRTAFARLRNFNKLFSGQAGDRMDLALFHLSTLKQRLRHIKTTPGSGSFKITEDDAATVLGWIPEE